MPGCSFISPCRLSLRRGLRMVPVGPREAQGEAHRHHRAPSFLRASPGFRGRRADGRGQCPELRALSLCLHHGLPAPEADPGGSRGGEALLAVPRLIIIALLSSLRRREMVYIFVLVSALLAVYSIRRRSRVTGALLASGILLLCVLRLFGEACGGEDDRAGVQGKPRCENPFASSQAGSAFCELPR